MVALRTAGREKEGYIMKPPWRGVSLRMFKRGGGRVTYINPGDLLVGVELGGGDDAEAVEAALEGEEQVSVGGV